MIEKVKENEKTKTKNVKKSNKYGWHFEYAAKMIESWPEWKKEIYKSNFQSTVRKTNQT